MSYCTQCGNALLPKSKFCASCGTKVSQEEQTAPKGGYAQQMQKNAVQSFGDAGRKIAGNKLHKQLTSMMPSTTATSQSTQPISEVFRPNESPDKSTAHTTSSGQTLDMWIWIYLLLVALTGYLGYMSEVVLAVVLLGIIAFVLTFKRRREPKPFNFIIKAILSIQIVMAIPYVLEYISYLTPLSLAMGLLVLVNIRLVFKGNKSN